MLLLSGIDWGSLASRERILSPRLLRLISVWRWRHASGVPWESPCLKLKTLLLLLLRWFLEAALVLIAATEVLLRVLILFGRIAETIALHFKLVDVATRLIWVGSVRGRPHHIVKPLEGLARLVLERNGRHHLVWGIRVKWTHRAILYIRPHHHILILDLE